MLDTELVGVVEERGGGDGVKVKVTVITVEFVDGLGVV